MARGRDGHGALFLGRAHRGPPVERARNAIAGLLALSPPQAGSVSPMARGRPWIKGIAVGAIVPGQAGERFASTAKVVARARAPSTRHPSLARASRRQGPGDDVFAGTINQSGFSSSRSPSRQSDTVLARIIHAVEQAQGSARHATLRRPVCRHVHAGRVRAGAGRCRRDAAAARLALADGRLQVAGAARHRFALCPGHLTPVTVVSGWPLQAARHPHQGRRLPRAGAQAHGGCAGQDRHVDRRQAPAGRPGGLDQGSPEAQVLRIAHSLAARSDHPVSKAVATGLDGEPVGIENFGAELGGAACTVVSTGTTSCLATIAGFTSGASARQSSSSCRRPTRRKGARCPCWRNTRRAGDVRSRGHHQGDSRKPSPS